MVSSVEPLSALQCPDWSQVRMEDLGSLFSGNSFSSKDGCSLFWAAPVSPSSTDDDEEEEASLEDCAAAELAEQLAHSMLDEDDELTEAEEAMSGGASPHTFAAHPLQLLNTSWNTSHLHPHSHTSSSASGSLGSSPTSARTGSSAADWDFLHEIPQLLVSHLDKSSSLPGCPSSPHPPPARPATRPHRPAAVAPLPLESAAATTCAATLLPSSPPVMRKAPPCVYVQTTAAPANEAAAANKGAPAGRRSPWESPVVVDVEMVMQASSKLQQQQQQLGRGAREAQAGGGAPAQQQQQQPPTTRSSRRSSGRSSRRNKLSSSGAPPPPAPHHLRPAPHRVPGLQPLGVWQSGGGAAGLGAVAGGAVTPAAYAGPALPSGLRAVFVHTGAQGGGVREAAGTGTGVFLPRAGVGGEQRAPVGRSGGNSRKTSGSTVLLPSRLVEVLNLSVDHPYASSRPTPITAALHKQQGAGGPHARRDANGHTGRPPRSPPPTRPHGKARSSPFPPPATMAYVPVVSSAAKCVPKQPEMFSGFELPSEWTY